MHVLGQPDQLFLHGAQQRQGFVRRADELLQLREVDVECLPGDIPEHLKVEVFDLHIGDHVTVANLIYDREKVKLLADEHQIVAGVLAPRMIEEVAPAAALPEAEAAEAVEPEVIKKGKAEEEEE